MARQRFIWPSMWTDKTFGQLTSDEKLLFISLFSIADDEGRISGEPAFLKAATFPYESYSVLKVEKIRDSVVAKMRNVRLYQADGEHYIALLQWSEYQKPKYPKPSRIPPPLGEDSGNVPGTLEERSSMGWVGLGREGLDSATSGSPAPSGATQQPLRRRPKAVPQPRERDEIWDTLVDLLGAEAAGMERGRWNVACKSLRESGATPERLRQAATAYKTHPSFAMCVMTPTALAANWTVLTATPQSADELERERVRKRIEALDQRGAA